MLGRTIPALTHLMNPSAFGDSAIQLLKNCSCRASGVEEYLKKEEEKRHGQLPRRCRRSISQSRQPCLGDNLATGNTLFSGGTRGTNAPKDIPLRLTSRELGKLVSWS